MTNVVTKSVPDLIAKSGVVIAGLDEYGATLGLVRHTTASVTLLRTDVITADGGYKQKKGELRAKRLALQSVSNAARAFAMQVRDSLKPTLGIQHSAAWNEVGFINSLYVSEDPAKLKVLMLDIKGYLTRNPDAEIVARNLTAVRADAFSTQLTTAIDDVAAAKYNDRSARTTRDAAVGVLRVALRGVINELNEEIEPMSDHWLAFGFNKPGQAVTPAVPAGLIAVLVGPTSVALKWNKAARAERYRIYKKVVGVDNEMVLVETREDLDFTIDALPAGKTIQIAVAAVNNGGESQLSEVVSIVTP